MDSQLPRLTKVGLRFLVLLPAAYLLWYFLAAWWLTPLSHVVEVTSQWLYPKTVDAVMQDGVFLFVLVDPNNSGTLPVLRLKADGRIFGVFKVYTPPLGGGIPIFLALALASTAGPLRHLINLLIGGLVLMAGHALSIVVKIGATLFSEVPDFRPSNTYCSAECYWDLFFPLQYFTYLILPTLLAVVTWAVLYRSYLRRVILSLGGAASRSLSARP